MPGFSSFNKHLAGKLLWLLLTLIGIAFLSSLGFWQLHRAEEKKIILQKEAQQATIAPVLWESGQELPLQYVRIALTGTYLPDIFLLDNQHGKNHQFGFHVISPLLLPDETVVLIDRGFVTGSPLRQTFPVIHTPSETLTVQGIAWYPHLLPWTMGPLYEKKQAGLTIVEHIDTKMISGLLQKPIYPFIMRLHKAEKYGFEREWVLVSMQPERHQAYALQWFAMAVVLLFIYVGLNFRKKP
jgi:surfeit locus 1 family protein